MKTKEVEQTTTMAMINSFQTGFLVVKKEIVNRFVKKIIAYCSDG